MGSQEYQFPVTPEKANNGNNNSVPSTAYNYFTIGNE